MRDPWSGQEVIGAVAVALVLLIAVLGLFKCGMGLP